MKMNADQVNSLIRTGLKVVAGIMAAHGLQDSAGYLNTPDVVAAICLAVSMLWSHFAHKPPPSASGGSSNAGGPLLLVAISVMLAGVLFCGTGCKSSPQAVTYQVAATSSVTVETAIHAYDVFAGQGKTTPAMNARVKAAYERYQAAMAVVCDAGAVYAATATTNAPSASAALQTAIVNANGTITDLVNLVRSFGVNL